MSSVHHQTEWASVLYPEVVHYLWISVLKAGAIL
jgi:hypothetical protein